MEKVKLPKEVAEAIDGVKNHANESILYDIPYMSDVCENDKFDAPKLQPIWNWINQNSRKEYFKALVNGYEVEMTPEDKVREAYNGYLDENMEPIDYGLKEHTEFMRGIRTALNLLGIKISGVNAE